MSDNIVMQPQSIILPLYHPLGVELETVADLVTHISVEFPVALLQEKQIQIVAVESVAFAAVPGNLLIRVELSPVPSTVSANYWAAIAGGVIIVGTGVNLARHTDMLAWLMHSEWARIVVQTPIAAGLPNGFWGVQLIFQGKGI